MLAQLDNAAAGASACSLAPGPVRVRKCVQPGWCSLPGHALDVSRAADEIAPNALQNGPVRDLGLRHSAAGLLARILQINSVLCKEVEACSDASVASRISRLHQLARGSLGDMRPIC